MANKKVGKVVFGLVTLAFTGFVFANTYEVVFNRDIPVAQSITRVATQDAIDGAVEDFKTKISSDNAVTTAPIENFDHIEIPALDIQLKLEESRKVKGEWYERPSTGHYIGLNKDAAGVTVDYLIYASKSWRTIPSPALIEKGAEVLIYHGSGGRSSFTVAEKKVLPLDHSLLVSKSENRQILLIIEDTSNNLYYGYSLVMES
jgi:hypothetical protein